ncbi:MAG TPA: hypothetical protein VFX59_15375, partial [Polyangiales bacterium]|nr:hypothetical protein [Polyangiales bacterium]
MKLALYASVWAFGSVDACLERVRAGLFDGVEGPVSCGPRVRAEGVPYLAELCTGGDYAPPSAVPESLHFDQFRAQLDQAGDATLVNCLTGSDAWPLAQSIDYLGRALEHAQGIELSFETHRGRPLFHPANTFAIASALPSLQLTCDLSHWCVVCERLVDHE